ncbi:MAG: hypothetical protein C4519_22205 [Desulfobacteraceae bacterium]|nr:MAG: hypothetical protein C4519_22205 [Desulfobacteraceae bacterium]
MKIKEVPQDDNKTFKGYGNKAVYALDENGRYTKIATSGWEVEEVVLRDVLADFEALAAEAKKRVREGKSSPLEYFIYKRLMDVSGLAQAMGIAKWRVKRHLKPKFFNKLNDKLLQRYAELLRIDITVLKNFKENPSIDPNF